MAALRPLPATGEVFFDTRGANRALRVTWHFDSDLVNLSLWSGNVCTGSFRLPVEQVPDLIELLQTGLRTSEVVATSRRHQAG
ncbi:hypothetical protein [Nocardioides panacisoli]|uniref:Uncharacterized protein n=1 Tax=Nocardioides panacisoli TaxID=627624 RepID=A0ABP7I5X3_9ACTN